MKNVLWMLSACLLSVSEVQVRVELSQLTQDCNNSVTKKSKYCWSYSDFSARASKRHLFFFSAHVAIVVPPTKRTIMCVSSSVFLFLWDFTVQNHLELSHTEPWCSSCVQPLCETSCFGSLPLPLNFLMICDTCQQKVWTACRWSTWGDHIRYVCSHWHHPEKRGEKTV